MPEEWSAPASLQPPPRSSDSSHPPPFRNPHMSVEDCAPPPRFLVPPPPRPPYLPGLEPACGFHSCALRPVIDAEYHSSPVLPSLLSISIASGFLLFTLLFFTALLCKHQRKMRNLLPCKTLPQSQCDISHQGAGVLYDDMTNIHPRTLPQAPIEMLDVKKQNKWIGVRGYTGSRGGFTGNGFPAAAYPVITQPPVFICPPPMQQHQHYSQDLYNPVYEELSNCSESKRCESEGTSDFENRGNCSEDDFAEDESSVAGVSVSKRGKAHAQSETNLVIRGSGSLTGRRSKSPMSNKFRSWKEKEAKSLERRRSKARQGEPGFHEGLLLDALLQLYPNPVGQSQFPCILPMPPNHYETIIKPQSRHSDQTSLRQYNDSDSGYSHNTSEDRGSSIKDRNHTHYISDSPSILL